MVVRISIAQYCRIQPRVLDRAIYDLGPPGMRLKEVMLLRTVSDNMYG